MAKASGRAAGRGPSAVLDVGEEFYPDRWDHNFMVYPVGSARVTERTAAYMTREQWAKAVELLRAGYVVGFSAGEDEAPDIACDLAQRCEGFIVAALFDRSDDVVYFVRRDRRASTKR